MPADPQRVQAVFLAAVEHADPADRAAVLDRECGADAELRRRVEALLAAHDEPGSLLPQPVVAPELTVDEIPANPGPPSDPRPAEGVGTVVAGRYKLLQQIGEGGMGSVFMAEQTRPVKRMVAVKLIKAGMDSRQVLARFESERQALALMDHPNIAKVLDAGTAERGHPFFVMELVKGVPLTQFCDDRRLSVGDRLAVFLQICRAVQHAHMKGIIHRDLKPTNILVESHDGKPVPKVIDFGLAKAVNALPLTDRSLFTHFGAVLGTPLYMAPEQAEFSAIDVDTRADVYALGVILYELLTGTTPLEKKRFAEAAWDEIRRVIKEEEPQTPSARLSSGEGRASIAAQRHTEPNKLGKFVRGELDWIVMKALAKERDRRYDTANAFAADVERFLNDEPVMAGPPTVGYKVRKFVHRHRSQVAVAAVLLFALVAGATVSTWQAIRATRAEGVAEQRRQDADDERKKAETQAASLAVDIDLKYCEEDLKLGLLRLAQTLPTIPEHAKELRECVALNILAWGQRLRPAVGTLDHDGYQVDQIVLSPDGLTVLTSGKDGTARLWDSLTGRQRAILREPQPRIQRTSAPFWTSVLFSNDGRTALTLCDIDGGGDDSVKLWDVATGRPRASLSDPLGSGVEAKLSHDGSRVVTSHKSPGRSDSNAVFFWLNFWNGTTGRAIEKLKLEVSGDPKFEVSPDGRSVLIDVDNGYEVWRPEEGGLRQRLPGSAGAKPGSELSLRSAFSPTGRSAVTISDTKVRWWDTADWHLRSETTSPFRLTNEPDYDQRYIEEIVFPQEDVVAFVACELMGDWFQRVACVRGSETPILVKTKTKTKEATDPWTSQVLLGGPMPGNGTNQMRVSPGGTAVAAFDTDEVYDPRSGNRLVPPRGSKFHPGLRQLATDGRYLLFPRACIADLAVEKRIGFASDSRFLTKQDAWVGIEPNGGITFLRKADGSLDADLLQKWCQILTRGKLDDDGRYGKSDEATWEKLRQELALELETNANAQVLRSATADRLYWLRQEIKGAAAPLPLLDRLVAAEPTWANYDRRARIHIKLEQWYQAMRDELEAARLTGDRYWRGDRRDLVGADWLIARLARAPDRPREQYELALRWAEANKRAGVSELLIDQPGGDPPRLARRPMMIGLMQFRLGRYADALATLRQNDVRKLSHAAGMLMSPWNSLTTYEHAINGYGLVVTIKPTGMGVPGGRSGGWRTTTELTFETMDLVVRAMCHHHLGHPKEAATCLGHSYERFGTEIDYDGTDDLLREAETLIEGKARDRAARADVSGGTATPLLVMAPLASTHPFPESPDDRVGDGPSKSLRNFSRASGVNLSTSSGVNP